MGTPVPDEWPGLEDNKWYLIFLDVYGFNGPPFDCTMNHLGGIYCCYQGDDIKRSLEHECEANSPDWVICGADLEDAAFRSTCIMGPYDILADCLAAAPEGPP